MVVEIISTYINIKLVYKQNTLLLFIWCHMRTVPGLGCCSLKLTKEETKGKNEYGEMAEEEKDVHLVQ